jgi:hypothetical protein
MSDLTLTTAAQTNITSVGTLTALTVDDITINGSTISDAADLTIDVGGDITLDADGGDILFKDGGTGVLYFGIANSSATLMTQVSDADMIFKGNDGGSTVTALTLDMSAAGAATFNGKITADAGIDIDNFNIDGTTLALSSGNFLLDVAGNITLDSDNGFVEIADGGTDIGHFSHGGSGLFEIKVLTSDADLKIQGNDGGSAIDALVFDMSAAGAATFNNDVTAFSDARLKDNVETIPNALETVCAMRGVNFTRNDNNDQPGTGVIAQEMQEVFPVVVKENNDENNTLSVSYGNLVGVLIESIKELKAEIDELKGN